MENHVRGMYPDPVEIIRKFVIETYAEGLSIVQELVQNANDAQASDMIVRYCGKGLKGTRHPLLKNPMVLVMNDGPFTRENEDALHRIGVGTKDASSETIGHFGLGMKSIFHWCDMFFYLTTDGAFKGAINPFVDLKTETDLRHPLWNYSDDDEFHNDISALNSLISSYLPSKTSKPYFCLAIPLRVESSDPRMEYVDRTFFNECDLKRLLGLRDSMSELKSSMTGMLATLSCTSNVKKLKSVTIGDDSYAIDCRITEKTVSIIENGDASNMLRSSVYGCAAPIPTGTQRVLDAIQMSSSWDQKHVGGNEVSSKDLYDLSDCSLIIIKSPVSDGMPMLTFSYASYLPLKKKEQVITRRLSGASYSYSVVFNAPFVIDSGRNGIDQYEYIMEALGRNGQDCMPFDEDALLALIQHYHSSSDVHRLWNLILMRDILYAELPESLMDAGIPLDDLPIIFDAISSDWDSRTRILRTLATRREYIALTLTEENGIAYQLCYGHDVLYLPKPWGELQMKSPEFMAFLRSIAGDFRIVFCDDDGRIRGLAEKSNLSEVILFSDLERVLKYLSGRYSSVLSISTFGVYFENLMKITFADMQYGDDHESVAAECVKDLKTILSHFVAREGLIGIPSNFTDILRLISQRIEKHISVYFRFLDDTDTSFFLDNWVNASSVIFIPSSRAGNDIVPFGTAISNMENHFVSDVKPLMHGNGGTERQGEIFNACVLAVIPRGSLSSADMQGTLKRVFSSEKIIPAVMYSDKGRTTGQYVSYGMLDSSYRELGVQGQEDPKLFYKFSPESEPVYMIDGSARTGFGIADNALRSFVLTDFAAERLKEYSHLNREYAEPMLMKIIGLGTKQIFAQYQIFPTVDGRFARMSDPESYIISGTMEGWDVLKSLPFYNFISIEDGTLRKNLEEAYSTKKLDQSTFLRLYLLQADKVDVDKDVIYSLRDFWKYQESYIRDSKWFCPEGGTRRYTCSRILFRRDLPATVMEDLGSDFLFITDEMADSDPCLRELIRKGMICGSLENINEGFVRTAYCGVVPIFRYSPSGTDDPGLTQGIFSDLVRAYVHIGNDDEPLCRWGIFLDAFLSRLGSRDDRNTAFVRLHRLIFDTSKHLSVTNALYNVLRGLSGRTDAFLYVTGILHESSLQLDPIRAQDIRFPTMINDLWDNLSELFDHEKYPSISYEHQLSFRVNLDIFSLPSHYEPRPIDHKGQELSYFTMMSTFKGISLSLLSELLFISCDPVSRQEVLARSVANVDEEFYISKFSAKYTHAGKYSMDDFFAYPANEVFLLDKPVRFKHPSVSFYLVDRNGAQYGHTIAGKTRKLDFKDDAASTELLSGLDSVGNGRWECYLQKTNHEVNEQFIDLADTIMHKVFLQKADFKPEFRAIMASGDDFDVHVSQLRITGKIDSILHSLRTSTDDTYGELVENYKAQFGKMDRDYSTWKARSNEAESAAKIRTIQASIDAKREEVISQLIDDRGFRSYILAAFCRSISDVAYDAGSVPYEFFQNADDASLQQKYCNPDPAMKYYFSIKEEGGNLVIENNGRLVNYSPEKLGHEEWHDDLTNMLTFSSGKQHNRDILETGKFGYGFKSCYFLSEEPEIHSGPLNVKIFGGIYPTRCDALDNINPSATRFVLPLREDQKVVVNKEILTAFARDAQQLLLFSKAIDNITVGSKTYSRNIVASEGPYTIMDIEDRFFVVDLPNDRGKMAFPLSRVDHSFGTVPESARTVWCTTPIEMKGKVDYYLNSSQFRIDLGRNQLALGTDTNEKLFNEFADALGRLMLDVYDATLPSSIKSLLKTGPASAGKLADRTAAGQDSQVFGSVFRRAYLEFTKTKGIFYTGYEWKTCSNNAQYFIIETALGAKNRIKADLQKVIYDFLDCHMKRAGEVLLLDRKSLLPYGASDAEMILRLEDLFEKVARIQPDLTAEAHKKLNAINEAYDTEDRSSGFFRYQAKNGIYHRPSELVWPESTLYSMAPEELKAIEEYGVSFRSSISVPVKVSWMINADTDEKRRVVMDVLSSDIESYASYREQLLSCPWIRQSWRKYAQGISEFKIPVLEKFFCKVAAEPVEYMGRVYAKWKALSIAQRKEFISQYRVNQFGKDALNLENSKSDDWYRLLYITALGSMGRVIPASNISFVRKFMEQSNDPNYPLKYNEAPVNVDSTCSENADIWMKYMVLSPVDPCSAMSGSFSQFEEWRKYLPLFAQLSMASEILYDCMTTMPSHSFYDSLNYSNTKQFEGTGIVGPDLRHALGKYYPIILRELLSNSSGKKLNKSVASRMLEESFYATKTIREQLGLQNIPMYTCKEFYERCYKYIQNHTEYTGFINDGAYPFYFFEGYDDMFME